MSTLHQLAREGNVEEARQLIANTAAAGGDAATAALLNATDKLQRTPLHLAAWAGKSEVIALLLAQASATKGQPLFDVHAEAMDSTTALTFAAQAGSVDCCRRLLDAGARVDARSGKASRTPLMLAARKGHAEVVRLLLEAGASALLKDSGKQTAADQTTDVAIRGLIEAAYDRQTEALEARRRQNQEARERATAAAAAEKEAAEEEGEAEEGAEAAEPAPASAPAPAPAEGGAEEGEEERGGSKRPAEEEAAAAAGSAERKEKATEAGSEEEAAAAAATAAAEPSKKKPKVALSFQDDMEDESDLL